MLAVDITEFLRNPIRTGIQRVVRELLTHWPTDVDKEIVRFESDSGRFVSVSPEIVGYAVEAAADVHSDLADVTTTIEAVLSTSPIRVVVVERGDHVLVPELFAALDRIRFYARLRGAGVHFFPIVYDMLAWTDPDALNIPYVGGLNDYLGFLFGAKRRVFISRSVHDVFHARFLRAPGGDDGVVPLGSDSLQRSVSPALRSRPYFVCVGSLDGRKGQDVVHRAFIASEASKHLDIVFAGKVPADVRPEMLAVVASTHPGVVVVNDPDDTALAGLIQNAQASIFVSRHEGFGLPAVESLYLGTPVVVHADLPSVSNLDTHGQVRLRDTSEFELVTAMNRLAEPTFALGLKAEISKLALGTWDRYARAIATWASDVQVAGRVSSLT